MRTERRSPTAARPLDSARLDELALRYVARFATSAAKLEAYLRRKVRERGWAGEGEPPVGEAAARMVRAGYVDDEAFARSKSGSLLRRGYGSRRIGEALQAAGIAEEVRAAVRAGPAAERRAALALAVKRRFGPFGPPAPDRAVREKQLSAMLRAGHRLDMARELLDFPNIAAAESWANEEEDEV